MINKLKFKKNKGGFSLIELLVSIAILVVVSGLVFFNQSGFSNSVLIENLAYEISLTIRQAQSYGLQSKETSTVDDFESGYGVYFDLSNPTEIVLYADKNKDHFYDEVFDTIIDELKMTNGSSVVSLSIDGNPATKMSVSFIRPNPTAYINKNFGLSGSKGEIIIESLKGEQKQITINKVGQMSIEPI